MRGLTRLVAGGRAAVAGVSSAAGSSSSSSSRSCSSLLKPSRAAVAVSTSPLVLRSLARTPAASMLTATRRSYASSLSNTTSTSLLDELESEIDERPDVPAEVIEADEKAAVKAGLAQPSDTPAAPEQESREAVLKRLADQKWSPEMWANGRRKTLYDRRLKVAQDGAADECRWKTDPFDSSVWKLNRVARLIRRMPVDEALLQLKFSEKRSAIRLYTSLLEGKRRAIEKGLNEERLFIHEAYAEKGIVIKRIAIMGRGRSGVKLKKSARIYFVLKEDKTHVEKVDAKHLHELHKMQIQGPNAHRPTHRKKVKIEGASTSEWRW